MIIKNIHLIIIILLKIIDLFYNYVLLKKSIYLDLKLAFIGAFLGFIVFFIVKIISKSSVGFGDIKFMTVLGFFIGDVKILSIIILSTFLIVIYSFLKLFILKISKKSLIKKDLKKIKVPFAPFVMLATIFVLFIL